MIIDRGPGSCPNRRCGTCYMKRRLALCALSAAAALVVVDVVFSIFATGLANKPSANHPSYTIADSKARGAFIERVAVTPSVIDWHGQRIVLKETWLEHQTELVQIYVIVPFLWKHHQYRKTQGYNLCVNLDEGWDALWSPTAPFFVVEGQGSGFAQRGTVVLWERLDDLEQFPAKVLLTDNWKFENSQALAIKRAPG